MQANSDLSAQLEDVRRVGLFGGSFDPPHGGHLAMARGASKAHGLGHVIWVPAARPPHKPERRLASAQGRLDMLKLLLRDEPATSIWTLELERPGESYTIDTLRSLRAALPEPVELFLILGSDNLAGFPSWRECDALLELAQPIVMPRSGYAISSEALGGLEAGAQARLMAGVVEQDPIDISSTEIRQALAEGSARPAQLPQELWDYLLEHGSYGG